MDINRKIVTSSKDAVYLDVVDDKNLGANMIPAEYFSKLPEKIEKFLDVKSLKELGYTDPDNLDELTATVSKLEKTINA